MATVFICLLVGYVMHNISYDWFFTLLFTLWQIPTFGLQYCRSNMGYIKLAHCSFDFRPNWGTSSTDCSMGSSPSSGKKAIDELNHKYCAQLATGEFALGTWVLTHETWLDTQVSNKGALCWKSPFIIHKKIWEKVYQLTELDGTVKCEHYFVT